MKPFYHEAAKLLKTEEKYSTKFPIILAKIDATAETKLKTKYEIKSYPTIFVFRKHSSEVAKYEYDGPRDSGEGSFNRSCLW
jgi:hypothetical protein